MNRRVRYWTLRGEVEYRGLFQYETRERAEACAKTIRADGFGPVEVVPVYREPVAWIVKSRLLRDQYWGGGFTFVAQQKRAARFATKASAKRASRLHGGKVVALVRKETA